MDTPHLLFFCWHQAEGGIHPLPQESARQELNSGDNPVAGTVQSLTRRNKRAGLVHGARPSIA
jgi:hypothetical protein